MNDVVRANKIKLDNLIEFAKTNYEIDDVIMYSGDYSSVTFNTRFGSLTVDINEGFCFTYITDKIIQITTGPIGSFCNTSHFRRWQTNFNEVVRKVIGLSEIWE